MLSKFLITLVALLDLFGAAIADYNSSHIFNPLWPPHAVFHDGQTILLSIALGLSTLYYCWLARGDSRQNIYVAINFASLYWVTQSLSVFFPGAAYFDPNVKAVCVGPFPVQLVIDFTAFMVLALAAVCVEREPRIIAE